MEEKFYKEAKKWYNTLYVNPASERLIYFVICLISIFCLYQAYQTIKIIKNYKSYKNTYVLLMNHKNKDMHIVINKMPPSSDQNLSLLKIYIEKYVYNYENLIYEIDNSGIDAINDKSVIIKNLSGKDVYDKYISNLYNENGDMTLAVLHQKKMISIKKIDFIYDNLNILEKFHSKILSTVTPRGAKVYFTSETTGEKNKKQNFVATMSFNFHIDTERKYNTTIDFKVNDYYIEKYNADLNSKK